MAIIINRTTSLDGMILPEAIPGLLYMNENQAHQFVISCTRGGSAVTLTGSVTGRFLRADGQTILLTGTITSGKAVLTLPQSCYVVPGRYTLAVFNTVSSTTTTIYAATGNVARTQTGVLVDPGNVVPDIDDLLAEIDAMREATADAEAAATKAVRYDEAQTLTEAQKITARGNIGGAESTETNGTRNLVATFIKTVNGISLLSGCGAEYTISSEGVWTYTGSKHIVFPVQPGASIDITARPAPGSSVYAFLKSYKIAYNEAADFCDGYNSRVVMSGGATASVVAPSDCNYLYVAISNQSGANSAPDALTIDGVDVLFNIRSRVGHSVFSAGIVADSFDVDDLLPNTIVGVATSSIESVAHFPKLFGVGGTIVTMQYNTNLSTLSGRSQLFFPLASETVNVDSIFAYRTCISGVWAEWKYHGYYKLTVNVGAGELFTNPANALKYYTSETEFYKWNEHRRLEMVVAPGTYSLNDIILWYADDPITYRQGLFIPPYATIRGSGKKRTVLRYTPTFTDLDDERLSSIAPLNMPYESTLKDLSLVVKNCRYCIHSEGTFEGFPDGTKPIPSSYVNNCQITLENVYLEHMGIEAQYTPRYTAPACWGSGSYNNSNQTFKNCEFISAQYSAWLNHNRVGLTDASRFDFDNCVFINKNSISYDELGVYSSMMFISWADDDIKNPVSMKNCFANRMVLSAVRSGDPASDTPKNNYYIMADNDIYIVEQITNNAHRTDNYISGNCFTGYANEALSVAYAPVSYDEDGKVGAYSSSALLHGIVLHTAAQGDVVCVQIKGRISLARSRVSGFNVGDYVGYSNGTWVLDTTNPIIRIITANIGEIV